MGLRLKNIGQFSVLALLILFVWSSNASRPITSNKEVDLPVVEILPVDSPEIELPYPINDEINPFGQNGRINLTDPSNVDNVIEYDPETGKYYFYQRIGGTIDYRNPTVMTFDEYMAYINRNSINDYWKEIRSASDISSDDDDGPDPFRPSLQINSKAFDRIFGGNTVDIRPQGTAELTFGANINKNENPQIPVDQRSITTFNFDQRIQLNVVGNIGEKLKLTTNYNTEATFDFENQTKIEYTGYEDEIIQKIEAGNVSMPLNNSLISGSQSLFGIKSELKFGRLTATALFSQERGQKKEINVQGGAQTQDYEITIDDYEMNRHFFLSGYFRANYDRALRNLPVVNSGVQITRIEVWIVNQTANVQDTRNVIGFTDLGEDAAYQNPALPIDIGDNPLNNFADNSQNNLYNIVNSDPAIRGFTNSSQALSNLGLVNGRDFERLSNARQLNPSEYTYNQRLGFISLNQALNNAEVLAVAYQYTLNGSTYQVGDFGNDGFVSPDALYLKLLKSTIVDVTNPMWDLMMKNVYTLGAYQVNSDQFMLNVWYNDRQEGVDVPVIPEPEVENFPLLQLLELDKLDLNGNPTPDGRFDFVDNAATEGGTINSQNGRIYFPVIEPFGSYLEEQLQEAGVDQNRIDQIVYPQLYDSTKIVAQQNFLYLNRFKIKGSYRSASSDEISLNTLNIPQGAVQVTAGGVQLVENQDYTVDYNLGRVKILNTGLLESQTPIRITVESNTLFSIQTRRLMGARFDYRFNENFNLGGTIMNLNERPLTQKVNIGDEPMNNTLWGLDAHFQDESRLLTDIVDALPGISTKETSSVDASVEFAHLLPGHNKAIGQTGNAYIDDFEGSISLIDLRNFASWGLASIPQFQQSLFPEAQFTDDRVLGYNRAKMAWYILDPLFFRNNNLTPPDVNNDRHYQREVTEREVFPNRELPAGTPANIATLDLSFFPNERGPYNYDAEPTSVSDGIDPETGELENPESRWGGIQRPINTTNFEQTNIEFIQFWIMDPYNSDSRQFVGTSGNPNGKLLVNIGNVSEDVLRDGQMSFENGLPIDPQNPEGLDTDTTNWAQVPITQSIVNAFDNTTNSNATQDVGFDGFDDAGERIYYEEFLDRITAIPGVSPEVVAEATEDPSTDNYHFYRGSDYDAQSLDILERYKMFNGFEGNSVTTQDSPEPYPTQATILPTTEDINQDLTLGEAESYYQYSLDLPDPQINPGSWAVGNNYITDVVEGIAPDGRIVNWYQFKIPVREGQSINNIQDLRSIRFMRLIATGFETPVVLRFARLELVRGEWRRYTESLREGEFIPGAPGETEFDILAVNVEENSQRIPLNYVTPPGISREIDAGTANLRSLNEQSLSLRVRNLADGDARAAFRSLDIDMRMYGNLEMFIHGETVDESNPLSFADVTVFLRMGTDFDQNFYEYEVPLEPTDLDAASTQNNIWPEENNMVIEFDKLQAAKNQRNQSGFEDQQIYVVADGDRRIRIKGNPVLSSIKTIMIGIRNPNSNGDPVYGNIWSPDDGLPESAEVWVNELRLTDFNNDGGWAAVARVNAQLADFGSVSVAGNISTPNFGSLESRVSERPQEQRMGYDASTNLELGKFLPEESGIKIPMYVGTAEEVVIPRFDPLAPDLELDEVTESLTREERREKRKQSQTYTKRTSVNFTNVRKERTDPNKKPRFYDIENFNATFAYSARNFYDINTAFDNQRQYRLGLGYNFSTQPTNIKPFASSKFLRSSDYLALIRDFNFNLMPKNFSFRSDINRTFNEQQFKNNSDVYDFEQPVLFTKTFTWNRVYDLQYDFSKSLRFTYSANNLSFITEPTGGDRTSTAYRDSIWSSIMEFGENVNFNQTFSGNWRVPIDKIPILDWITTDLRYSGSYNWQRAPFSQDTLGNNIQNARTISINGQFNFLTLYNKVPFFQEVNRKFQRQGRAGGRSLSRDRGRDDDQQDDKDTEPTKEDDKDKITALDYLAKLVMSLKNISVVYSQNEGTFLPGYNQRSNLIGMNPNWTAPGLDFVFGHQIANFNRQAALKGWLVENQFINQQYLETYTEDFNFRVNFEPLPNLRIELNAIRSKSLNDGSFFRFNDNLQQYLEDSRFESGSFSISLLTWNTIWSEDLDNNVSPIFEQFLNNRSDISNRLAVETGLSDPNSGINGEYADGFGPSSQSVVIPAFIAAYSGQNPDKVNLNIDDYSILDAIRNPSWSVNYDGLSKIPAIKNIFRNITIAHAYRSVFSVNNFTTNFAAGTDINGEPNRDNSEEQNFIANRQINAITISEQLSPLIRVDMTWQNSLITNFEISRNRTLTFSTTNYQLTENNSNEFVIGLGYRFPDVEIKLGGKKRKSDLNVRADLSIRDTEIIARRMVEGTNQITSGQNLISIKTAVDYVISDRLNIRAFYDHQINKPKVSISFPTSNINTGISLRFTLTQ